MSGSFTIGAGFTPQTNSMEVVDTFVDLRSQLILDVDVSGFRTRSDIAAGFTGIEHAIFGAFPTLGGVDVANQLAFATPFASIGIAGFTHLVPIGSFLFVTERAQATTRILGVTLSNLAIFEDINFIHPFPTLPFGSPTVLPAYTTQSQSFRFGDIVTLQGQIINGATLIMSTGISADPSLSKCVKGMCFPGAVVSTEKLGFVRETIALQNLMVGPVLLGANFTFRNTTLQSPTLTVNTQFNVLQLGRVNATFVSHFDNLVSLSSVTLATTAPPITITTSFTPALTVASIAAALTASLSPISSVVLQAIFTPPTGLSSESVSFFVSIPTGATFTAGISNGPSGPLLLTFNVNAQLSTALSASASVRFTPTPATTQIDLATTYRF